MPIDGARARISRVFLHQLPVGEAFLLLVLQEDVDHQSDTAHSNRRDQYGRPFATPFVPVEIRVQALEGWRGHTYRGWGGGS